MAGETGTINSNFQMILTQDDWDGLGDFENACWLTFEFDEGSATLDPGFVGPGKWAGWTVSGSETFKEQSPSCSNIYGDELTFLEHLKSSTFGVGAGPITPAMAETSEELFDEAGMDWVNDGLPYYFTQYVMLDFGELGGNLGWSPTNQGIVYEVDQDNILVTDEDNYLVGVSIEDAEWIPDGWMNGNLFYGFAVN